MTANNKHDRLADRINAFANQASPLLKNAFSTNTSKTSPNVEAITAMSRNAVTRVLSDDGGRDNSTFKVLEG